ncbi:MAG TPA: hypothetical protein HPP94_16805 [Desulfuromonadales bacterium]|nr:hypothetical protein [Desulfuromonadales bacterium]
MESARSRFRLNSTVAVTPGGDPCHVSRRQLTQGGNPARWPDLVQQSIPSASGHGDGPQVK